MIRKRIHQSPYHFSSTKSKGVLKEFFHVFLLYQLLKPSIIVYFRKICLTRTILVFIPESKKFLVKEVPSLCYCLQNPNFIWLETNKFTSKYTKTTSVYSWLCKYLRKKQMSNLPIHNRINMSSPKKKSYTKTNEMRSSSLKFKQEAIGEKTWKENKGGPFSFLFFFLIPLFKTFTVGTSVWPVNFCTRSLR